MNVDRENADANLRIRARIDVAGRTSMSDLGKIRDGSPRVFRDRIYGRRGECRIIPCSHSVDGLVRFVFHPDDVTEAQQTYLEAHIADLEQQARYPESARFTVFGLPIVGEP